MNYAAVIDRIKPSVALVVAFDSDNKMLGTGSGFIFSKKGILVTCNHVVKDAASLVVKFPDDESYITAKVALRDDEHDLALLKFENDIREPLSEYKEDIAEGMPVIFSGYPLSSMDLTTHQGILSAITKDQTGITSYLIDGTVNSGNSGCPLMDTEGKVIGVVDAKRRVRNELLEKVEKMNFGALSMHGVDLVEIYQALINNVQLGVGHAVPVNYIPDHKELSSSDKRTAIARKKSNGK